MNEITDHRVPPRELHRRRDEPHGLRLLATRALRRWFAVTLLLGVLFGPLLVAAATPEERTFALVSGPVQLMMSITVPFLGVLLAAGVRSGGRAALVPAVGTAMAAAVGVALFGAAVSAVSVAVRGSTAPGGPWRHSLAVVLGSVAVQVVAQAFGIGFGLLIRRPALACLATFSPLPVWALLGTVEIGRHSREWLTPAATAQALLAGDTPMAWIREVVVVGVWGGALCLSATRCRTPR